MMVPVWENGCGLLEKCKAAGLLLNYFFVWFTLVKKEVLAHELVYIFTNFKPEGDVKR